MSIQVVASVGPMEVSEIGTPDLCADLLGVQGVLVRVPAMVERKQIFNKEES